MLKKIMTPFRRFQVVNALLLIAVASSHAFLCEKTFYSLRAKEIRYEFTNPTAMGAPKIKQLNANLSDLVPLDSNIEYNAITSFSGGCDLPLFKPVTYWSKLRGKETFSSRVDSSFAIRFRDSNTQLVGQKFEYWFGFFKPVDTLRFAIGRDTAKPFMGWYGTYMVTDSSRNSSGISQFAVYFYPLLYGPLDSANIADVIFKKLPAPAEAGHIRKYSLQFVGVEYDTLVPVAIRRTRSQNFSTDLKVQFVSDGIQLHSQVITNENQATLFDMFGHRIATLNRKQDTWFWNGRNEQNQLATGGVYFLKAGNRILGRFLISPIN